MSDAPPPGYRLYAPVSPRSARASGALGGAHDGDTFRLNDGRNGRLFGVDAFELGQPFAMQGRDFLTSHLPGAVPSFTGAMTYGRPVVTLDQHGNDVGEGEVGAGLALPEPHYLTADPARRDRYISTQRDAIAAERGAYAGTYQTPSDYRHMGASAPLHGKIAMTPEQRSQYLALLSDPKTTGTQLAAWGAAQGRPIANADNILSLMRKNPGARVSTFFQQDDATGAPVLRDGPGLPTRLMGSLNEGIADLAGSPVDLVNTGLSLTGLPTSDHPIMGSRWISDRLHDIGIGQVDEGYAPRSTTERYGQAVARGVGQAALPVAGTLSMGSRLALSAPSAFTAASPARMAIRNALTEAAAAPAVATAAEVGGGVGANVAGQGAEDYDPGNQWLQLAAQTVGGLAGGVGAGMGARRVPSRLAEPRPVHAPPAGYVVDDATVAPLVAHGAPDGLEATHSAPIEAHPAPPPGYRLDTAPHSPASAPTQAMAVEGGPAVLTAPVRVPDRIDVSAPPPGYTLDAPIAGPRAAAERPTPAEMADVARRIEPGDVTPIPSNMIEGADEAAAASAGRYPEMRAPDERQQLPPYRANGRTRRNPIDLVTYFRGGGIQDEGGELAHRGIDNAPRDLDFARDEGFHGKLVTPDGAPLDTAAHAAWEAGYFPEHADRPTINEFLDALEATHKGGSGRVFHPDDYEAVDNYYAAQRQRQAVEHAQFEGSPLVEDRGEPVTPADLDANRPPATAYEDLPRIGGKVANLNLDHVQTPNDIRRVLSATETRVGGFDAARRGKVSHAETEALASEMGMSADDLLRRRRGQALNAEEALAARQLLAKSSDELVRLAGKVKAGGNADADLSAFRGAWLKHAAIQEQVSGMTAEAGRALSAFRAVADSRAISGRIHKLLVEHGGGQEHLEDVAGKIIDLHDAGVGPGGVTQFAVKMAKPRWQDKAVELWYNTLLSGPQTHVVNMTSNLLTAGLQLPEHAAAAAIGGARRAVGLGQEDRVMFAELPSRALGLIQGAQDGLRAFVRTMRTGHVMDHVTKVESASDEAISGLKGKIIRLPTRALSAEDEFFKAIARRSELAGLAVRKAGSEGLRGADAARRVDDLLANPPDEMFEHALDYARYVTFQRPTTGIAQSVSAMTQRSPILKLIIPFVRTPANILAYAAERSPLAPLVRSWRADMAAGGSRRDLAVARMALGTGLGALVVKLAHDGFITGGGPSDDNATGLMRADGWQPYSLKIGDTYYSYGRLDPLASTLGTAADLATKGEYMTESQRAEAAGIISASILNNLSNKTWLSGLSDVVDAIHDPERYGGSMIGKTVSSAVPALVAQTARTIDPTMRETNGLGASIMARLPGLSQRLPPRLDQWGRPITREGGLGPDFLSPVWTSTARNDPVNSEMLAAGARFGAPSRMVAGRKLTDAEFHDYKALAGTLTHGALAAAVAGPEWRTMTPEDREALADKIKRGSRSDARARLFGDAPKGRRTPGALALPPPGYALDAPPPPGYVPYR